MNHNQAPTISEHARLLPSVHHIPNEPTTESHVPKLRHFLRQFLSSRYAHYIVILFVSLDITCIFAEFLVSLHICEHSSERDFNLRAWDRVERVLGVLSLVFSSVFVVELVGSLFAFGFGYLKSPFHILDSTVIVASFVIDVALHGGLEEAGSLIIVLRLWRVFKIIEEFSTGAEDQMDELHVYIDKLRREKDEVVKENKSLKVRLDGI